MFPILCRRDLSISVKFETMRNDSILFLQAHMALSIKETVFSCIKETLSVWSRKWLQSTQSQVRNDVPLWLLKLNAPLLLGLISSRILVISGNKKEIYFSKLWNIYIFFWTILNFAKVLTLTLDKASLRRCL